MVAHLSSNGLLPEFQSAYRKGHSTETAVLEIFSDIVDDMDKGKFVLLSLLDLSAAFDTVDHDILLHRLSTSFGVSSDRTMMILSLRYVCTLLVQNPIER